MREKILALLSSHPNEFVSGEKMSEQLHLTRAGIWKHIQALRSLGYEIESQTKNGYRLVKYPLDLEEWAIKQKLMSLRLGKEIILYDKVESTNDLAKEMVRKGEGKDGLVILAKEQSAGRGRLQRRWASPLGGIWMSVVLKPNLSLEDAAKLTLCTGIAVTKALETELGLKTEIKWPNDIVYQGRKLAGILAEVAGEWNSIQTIIVGIGINANFPSNILPQETQGISILDILGSPIDLNQLAARILKELEDEVIFSEQYGFSTLVERWTERAAGLGEEVEIIQHGQCIKGKMVGITNDGKLILQTELGEKIFGAGEVRLRKKEKGYF